MTANIGQEDWVRFMGQEYLNSFIAEGGSAIKFAVPHDDAVHSVLMENLSEMALHSGYLVVRIDAAETKVNLIDEIFFRAAQEVPWRVLSQKVLSKLAAECGYGWVDVTEEPLYQRLAEHNRVDPQLLLLDLKKAIGNQVFKKRNLSRDFRIAMTHLCIAELSGGQDGSMTQNTLIDWLTGKNKAVSAVKSYQLFRKINRNTGRYLFESMLHWIKFWGYAGTVLLLDMKRVANAKALPDEGVHYSKAAVLDTYEVLRQFIDSADRLEACLFIAFADLSFLEDANRGMSAYEALKFRVFDEVRDKRLVNPMSSLARIAEVAEGVRHA